MIWEEPPTGGIICHHSVRYSSVNDISHAGFSMYSNFFDEMWIYVEHNVVPNLPRICQENIYLN